MQAQQRYNTRIRLDDTDKRVLAAARETPLCAPLFENGGIAGAGPKVIGKAHEALAQKLIDVSMEDIAHALAKLSASGRFAQ